MLSDPNKYLPSIQEDVKEQQEDEEDETLNRVMRDLASFKKLEDELE
jgi:hypothetical protein